MVFHQIVLPRNIELSLLRNIIITLSVTYSYLAVDITLYTRYKEFCILYGYTAEFANPSRSSSSTKTNRSPHPFFPRSVRVTRACAGDANWGSHSYRTLIGWLDTVYGAAVIIKRLLIIIRYNHA